MLLEACFRNLKTRFLILEARFIRFIYVVNIFSTDNIMAQEKRFTEAGAKKAYNACKKNPYLPAICFAEQMGFSPRHTTRELMTLVEAGIFEKIQYGSVYLFRPVKKEELTHSTP